MVHSPAPRTDDNRIAEANLVVAVPALGADLAI
jgi:hypothetical protein